MFHRNITGLFFMAEWQNWWYLLWKISRSSLCTSGSTQPRTIVGKMSPTQSFIFGYFFRNLTQVLEWSQGCPLEKNADSASGILQWAFPQSRKFRAGFLTCSIEEPPCHWLAWHTRFIISSTAQQHKILTLQFRWGTTLNYNYFILFKT